MNMMGLKQMVNYPLPHFLKDLPISRKALIQVLRSKVLIGVMRIRENPPLVETSPRLQAMEALENLNLVLK